MSPQNDKLTCLAPSMKDLKEKFGSRYGLMINQVKNTFLAIFIKLGNRMCGKFIRSPVLAVSVDILCLCPTYTDGSDVFRQGMTEL